MKPKDAQGGFRGQEKAKGGFIGWENLLPGGGLSMGKKPKTSEGAIT